MPSLIATFGGNITGLTKALNDAKREAALAGADMNKNMRLSSPVGASGIGGAVAGIGGRLKAEASGFLSHKIAAIASIGAIEQFAEHAIEVASHINDVSKRLGISTDAVQEWSYAMKQTGQDGDAFIGFFEKLSRNRQKALSGDEKAIEHFKKLGVSINDLKTKRLEDIGLSIGNTIKDGDAQKLSASLQAVGGKGAGALVTAFKEGLEPMFQEHRDLGLSIDKSIIEMLDEIGDKWTTIKEKATASFAPAVAGVAQLVVWMKQLNDDVQTFLVANIGGIAASIASFDISHPIDSLAKIATSPLTSARAGLDLIKQQHQAEKEAEEKRKNRRKGGTGGSIDSDEDGVVDKEEKRYQTLLKQTAEEERRGRLAAMNDREKAEALRKEIALLKEKQAVETDPVKKAELGLEIAKRSNELGADERKIAKDEEAEAKRKEKEELGATKRVMSKPQVNSLQQIGGFLGSYAQAPEVVMLEIQKKSEGHLLKIAAHSEAMRKGIDKLTGGTVKGGVKF